MSIHGFTNPFKSTSFNHPTNLDPKSDNSPLPDLTELFKNRVPQDSAAINSYSAEGLLEGRTSKGHFYILPSIIYKF